MPLTDEEVKQVNEGIEAGTPLAEIEALKPLSSVQSIMLTTKKAYEDDKTSAIQTAIDGRTSEWATNIEKDILELTGIEKNSDEKYHDYYKRAVASVKGDPAKVKELETQLEDLKKSGKVDEAVKKELEELKEAAKTQTETHNSELEKLRNENLTYVKTTEINRGLSGLKFKETLPESTISRERNWAVSQMLEMPSEIREQDGVKQYVFLDKNGHAERNPDNSYITPEQKAKELLKDVLAEDIKGAGSGSNGGKGGTGTGEGGTGEGSEEFGIDFEIPDTIESMEALDTFLKEKGITSKSESYDKITKHYKEVKKLPLSNRFGAGRKK